MCCVQYCTFRLIQSINHLVFSFHSNGGQMIKFQLFDSENSYQCHFSEIATFVVSIAHYMRAYFNYQALLYGQDFELPGDAGYLNVSSRDERSIF